jgi:hypothetical protein
MSKFSGGKPPDPHSKERVRKIRREGKKGRGGERWEGRKGEIWDGRGREGRKHPQIKFYDYRTV